MINTPASEQIFDAVVTDYDIIWSVKILFALLDIDLKRLGHWNSAHILDMACDTGFAEMKELGAARRIGIDIGVEMLEVAKKTFTDARFQYAATQTGMVDLHHVRAGDEVCSEVEGKDDKR